MAKNTTHDIISMEIPFLKISSQQEDILISRFEGKEGMSELYEFRIHFSHKHAKDDFLDLNGLIGEKVHITINNHETGKPMRSINGVVKKANIERLNKEGLTHIESDYIIEIVPEFWFLTRTQDCKIFQKKNVEEIIKEVLSEFSIDYEKPDLGTTSYTKYEYCVQYQESPYNFLQRLMEKEGLYYFFKHEKEETKLVIANHNNYKSIEGDDPIKWGEYETTIGGRVRSYKPVISEWLPSENTHISRVSQVDFDYFQAPKILPAGDLDYEPTKRKADDIFQYPAKFEKESQLSEHDQLTKVYEERLQTYKSVYRGITNCIDLIPGCTFKLDNFPDEKHNQEYLVTRLQTIIVPQDTSTVLRKASNRKFSNEGIEFRILSIPANKSEGENRQFRPQTMTPKPIIDGIQTAIVVGTEGEEVHTDEYGRVNVVFPWDRQFYKDNPKKLPTSSGSEKRSCPIRVSQSLAGHGWGTQFIPRIGQEVVVTFENGDPDRPLITGTVYNKQTGLPLTFSLPDKKFKNGWYTHSQKGTQTKGHELSFDDTEEKELFFIQAEKDFKANIKNNSDTEIVGAKTETIGKTLTIDVKEKITLKVGDSTIEITPNDIKIKSKTTDVKGDSAVNVNGGKINLNGPGGGGGGKIPSPGGKTPPGGQTPPPGEMPPGEMPPGGKPPGGMPPGGMPPGGMPPGGMPPGGMPPGKVPPTPGKVPPTPGKVPPPGKKLP